MDLRTFVVAQAHFTFEELYSKNSEDQEEEQNDQQYVKKRWDGENEGIDDSLDAFVFTNDSQWSQSSQSSETSYKLDVTLFLFVNQLHQNHGQDGKDDDDEIEHIPWVLDVSLGDPVEAMDDDFDHTFNNEDPRDDEQHLLNRFLLVLVF